MFKVVKSQFSMFEAKWMITIVPISHVIIIIYLNLNKTIKKKNPFNGEPASARMWSSTLLCVELIHGGLEGEWSGESMNY